MLIQCPECSREISSAAASCPHCGCPPLLTAHKADVVTEKTSKPYKAALMISVGVMMLGLFGTCASVPTGNASAGAGFAIFFLILFVGLIATVAAKVGAWWEHG
jgi:hypothetical protein